MKVTGIVRRLGNLRSAKIGESFHLSLGLLSLHFQTLLEHLLLVHELLTELLELPKHLCHLFSRHTKQSTSLDSQSRVDHNGNHSTATKTTGTQHCRSATMWNEYECEPVSCAHVLF